MNVLMRCLLLFVISCSTALADYPNEVTWCRDNAERYKAQNEVRLWDGSRCDFVTETEAIEVDWSYKWKEAPAQAVWYSIVLGKKPGIILLVKDMKKEAKYIYRATAVCEKLKIKLYIEIVKEE